MKIKKMLIIVTSIIIIVLGFASYSFVKYTTPNLFKVLYAKSYIHKNSVYYMGDSKYMILRKYEIHDTFVQFVDTINGDSLEKTSDGVTGFYIYNDNGNEKRIDVLVDTSIPESYMIIKIIDY